MKNRFDLLVFDWDGTLVDSIGWIIESLKFAAHDLGFEEPADRNARSVIGLSLDQAMGTLFPQAQASDIEALMASYKRFYNSRPLGPEALFAGVPQMVEALREAGYKLAVATGKSRQGLDHAMHTTGAVDWFDATRTAGETASKPDPLMLRQLLEELNVPAERTLMVGDSIHDMQMAKNAQIEAVSVFCGADERGRLLAFQPLLGLEQTAELLEFLI